MRKPLFPSEYRCGNCIYFQVSSEVTGTCRRHPPTKRNYVTEFPIVHLERDWCGEMKLRSAALAELEESTNTETTTTKE